MKIIGSRFRIRGKRPQATEKGTDVEREAEVVEQPTVNKLKKRALLIGVRQLRGEMLSQAVSPTSPLSPTALKKWRRKARRQTIEAPRILKGPHRDVLSMKNLLIETYKYAPSDINVLLDDDDPTHVQPTRANILNAITSLISDAREGDRFFFHFAGHSTQEATDDIEEEDGMDEFIITSDGLTIKDDELRDRLVKPLPPKSSLIAIFDSCHSGSLLDLKHFRCNQVYVPWLNRGQRRTNSQWYNHQRRQPAKVDSTSRAIQQIQRINTHLVRWTRTSIDQLLLSPEEAKLHDVVRVPVVTKRKTSLSIVTDALPSPMWLDTPIQRCASPEMLYCSGDCRSEALALAQANTPEQADVISFSSAQDDQRSWEDEDGRSMTQALVHILSNNPHPTFHALLTLVSHDLHEFYLTLHIKAREYRKRLQDYNRRREELGKRPKKGQSVEMNNFQNPQLSSDRPLDMTRSWYP